MKKFLFVIILSLLTCVEILAQTIVTIEGKDTTITGAAGYSITRTSPILLRFLNNRVLYTYTENPLLNAGTNDYTVGQSTNLNGAVIHGNSLTWRAGSQTGSTHAIMAGYNENYDIAYNYFDSTQYGVTHEGGYPDHSTMDNSDGGIYYNIFKDINYNIIEKGYAGTRIIGNTFYTNRNQFSVFIGIKESDTGGITEPYPTTSGTKVFNNIFYNDGTTAFHAITVGTGNDDTPGEMDTVGLEIDYNIYYYENRPNNEPTFEFNGVGKTWSEWRALGYDEHSVILDPEFIDFVDFVPGSKELISIGVDLGPEFQYALSTTAEWTPGEEPDKELQVGTWQVGARIYETEVVHHADFYVSPDGNDSNPGTYAEPWATWGKAFNSTAVQPGDTVYFRGGIYYMTTNNLAYPGTEGEGYNLGRDGTSGNYIHYFNYPGETPILDCGDVTPAGNHNRGIYGASDINYLHFRGLTVRNVYQTSASVSVIGWGISGDNNIIENCVVHDAGGKGFFGMGHNLYYINCDAYDNVDNLTADMPGNDGVGFTNADVTNIDGSIYYKNCRAWGNGDQGFSAISVGYLEFDGCWSFMNGNLQGEGHGFKMGEVGIPPNQPPFGPLKRKYVNNVATYNRANGWTTKDGNHDVHRMHIYNNIAYNNGWRTVNFAPMQYGFVIYSTASTLAEEMARDYKNNIAYKDEDGALFIDQTPRAAVFTSSNNSWDAGAPTVTDADFVSLDTTGITAPRQADGSFPDNNCYNNFLRLATGSGAIDAGTDVGLPYSGTAPDLGAFEFGGIDSTLTDILTFTLPTQTGAATINTTAHTVAIEVNYLATITNLTPYIAVSYGATISPESMISRDFTTPQTYTVTALDGTTTQSWTVTVTQEEGPTPSLNNPPVHNGRWIVHEGVWVKI